jgi:hypothetical protein
LGSSVKDAAWALSPTAWKPALPAMRAPAAGSTYGFSKSPSWNLLDQDAVCGLVDPSLAEQALVDRGEDVGRFVGAADLVDAGVDGQGEAFAPPCGPRPPTACRRPTAR